MDLFRMDDWKWGLVTGATLGMVVTLLTCWLRA